MMIMVVNCGSSSLKYQLFEMEKKQVLAKGICERIGIDGFLKHQPTGKVALSAEISMPTHADAMRIVMEHLLSPDHGVLESLTDIAAIGHRVAHGGAFFTRSTRIDKEVLAAIEKVVPLAPLHNPAALMGIRACFAVFGNDMPQAAVFDTAFHQTMPEEAYTYALPAALCEKHGIRRYGFHGTSHRYVAELAAGLLGKPFDETSIITCHLGNGSSITAIKNGKSIDTSMGFTPLEGLPMGTRCGNIDPAIIPFLARQEGMTLDEVDALMNKSSGLSGISGVSSDLRDIQEAAQAGDPQAKRAVGVLCYSIKKYIGSYMAAMGGVDAIVFTAGIGENSPIIREMSVAGLEQLGIVLSKEANRTGNSTEISAKDSSTKLYVIPTNEELVIAEDTVQCCLAD